MRDCDRPPSDAHADARRCCSARPACASASRTTSSCASGRLAASNAELVEQIARDRAQPRPRAGDRRAGARAALAPAGLRASADDVPDLGRHRRHVHRHRRQRRGGAARARQGAHHARARLRGAARGHRPGRRAPRALGRGAARADRGADLRHDARDERDRGGQDRAHGVLHDRGLPGHPAGARGRQARPVQADPVPAPVRPALAHVRDPRAHGRRGRAVPRARRGVRCWTRSTGRASCAPRRSRSACSGRSSTRRTSSASAS